MHKSDMWITQKYILQLLGIIKKTAPQYCGAVFLSHWDNINENPVRIYFSWNTLCNKSEFRPMVQREARILTIRNHCISNSPETFFFENFLCLCLCLCHFSGVCYYDNNPCNKWVYPPKVQMGVRLFLLSNHCMTNFLEP